MAEVVTHSTGMLTERGSNSLEPLRSTLPYSLEGGSIKMRSSVQL